MSTQVSHSSWCLPGLRLLVLLDTEPVRSIVCHGQFCLMSTPSRCFDQYRVKENNLQTQWKEDSGSGVMHGGRKTST